MHQNCTLQKSWRVNVTLTLHRYNSSCTHPCTHPWVQLELYAAKRFLTRAFSLDRRLPRIPLRLPRFFVTIAFCIARIAVACHGNARNASDFEIQSCFWAPKTRLGSHDLIFFARFQFFRVFSCAAPKVVRDLRFRKSLQHPKVFPRGPPPRYLPGPHRLNFRVQMGSGVFLKVWP